MRIDVRTERREQLMDITARVQDAVAESGVAEGDVLVYCPHTTAGITINEAADPDVATDILAMLHRLVPHAGEWRHAEGNSDAHVKATLVGSSVLVPLGGGRLSLGTWQGIYFCEFDGPRSRSITVSVRGGERS